MLTLSDIDFPAVAALLARYGLVLHRVADGQAIPGSYLVIHPFNPNWSHSYPIERFCAEFDQVFASYGLDPKRLVISSVNFPSRTDVKELLRVGDVYLDTFPFGGVNSLIDPLEIGLPVVTW